MPLTETETCMRLITPALEAAGWGIQTQIRREVTFTNCLLYGGDIPLAVIEAKKEGLGPAHGIQQALRYAEQHRIVAEVDDSWPSATPSRRAWSGRRRPASSSPPRSPAPSLPPNPFPPEKRIS